MPYNIAQCKQRAAEIEKQLSSPDILADKKNLSLLNKEYAAVREIIDTDDKLGAAEKTLRETKKIAGENTDPMLLELAEDEIDKLTTGIKQLRDKLETLTRPSDPLDQRDIIVEIRAGTGGDEAALFASELFRMYTRYAERRGWKIYLASANRTAIGGFKEVIFSIAGAGAYRALKYESGVHRVQRIPETEKSGRVHTSTATVAVLPEAEEVDIKIDPKNIRIDTMTAGGHGGQSVNTTYSAVRVTYIPTGTVVVCQDERSQQQNKARAMSILRARLFVDEQNRLSNARGDTRRAQIGSAKRAEKTRTYNFPQDRVTDHRIQKSFHNLAAILDGDIDMLIEAVRSQEPAPPPTQAASGADA